MNLEEMMIFYAAFALSGAVVTFTAIFMPALKYLRLHDNSNVVLRSWYTVVSYTHLTLPTSDLV